MSPDLFARLVVDGDCPAGGEPTPLYTPALQAPDALQRRLAHLAALRLARHELPQRSYLWWNRGENVQPVGCLA